MQMTEGEIRRDYASAKNKNMQIGILADLNCCSRKKIMEILGVQPRKRMTEKQMFEELDRLDEAIKDLEKQYKTIARVVMKGRANGKKTLNTK